MYWEYRCCGSLLWSQISGNVRKSIAGASYMKNQLPLLFPHDIYTGQPPQHLQVNMHVGESGLNGAI